MNELLLANILVEFAMFCKNLQNSQIKVKYTCFLLVVRACLCSVVVSTSDFHPGDPSSIPARGLTFIVKSKIVS